MPKVSEEVLNARKDEIINACAKLYETRSFKEITIKDIGTKTTLNRTSLYNYFQTKEEIFLALFKREYDLWTSEVAALKPPASGDRVEAFANAIARSLEKRTVLLKLLSMNMYDMEEESRMEYLIEFKCAYGRSIAAVRHCLQAFFPAMDNARAEAFLFTFFPFMYGIYPYVFVTEKQREAMDAAAISFPAISLYRLAHDTICQLLK